MKKRKIYSIFGQIATVAADEIAAKYNLTKIPLEHIPSSVRYDDRGVQASYALAMTKDEAAEFDKLHKQWRD